MDKKSNLMLWGKTKSVWTTRISASSSFSVASTEDKRNHFIIKKEMKLKKQCKILEISDQQSTNDDEWEDITDSVSDASIEVARKQHTQSLEYECSFSETLDVLFGKHEKQHRKFSTMHELFNDSDSDRVMPSFSPSPIENISLNSSDILAPTENKPVLLINDIKLVDCLLNKENDNDKILNSVRKLDINDINLISEQHNSRDHKNFIHRQLTSTPVKCNNECNVSFNLSEVKGTTKGNKQVQVDSGSTTFLYSLSETDKLNCLQSNNSKKECEQTEILNCLQKNESKKECENGSLKETDKLNCLQKNESKEECGNSSLKETDKLNCLQKNESKEECENGSLKETDKLNFLQKNDSRKQSENSSLREMDKLNYLQINDNKKEYKDNTEEQENNKIEKLQLKPTKSKTASKQQKRKKRKPPKHNTKKELRNDVIFKPKNNSNKIKNLPNEYPICCLVNLMAKEKPKAQKTLTPEQRYQMKRKHKELMENSPYPICCLVSFFKEELSKLKEKKIKLNYC